MTQLYKLLNEDGTPCNGGTGPAWAPPGEWMPPAVGKLVPCKNGYHLCTIDHLLPWAGPALWTAEAGEEFVVHEDNKICTRTARRLVKVVTWNDRNLRLFAADCAEHALPSYLASEPEDGGMAVMLTIHIVREFAEGRADMDDLVAAWDAARDATMAAAGGADWGADWGAARDAAKAARDATGATAGAAAWIAAGAAARDARDAIGATAGAAAWIAAGAAAKAATRDARDAARAARYSARATAWDAAREAARAAAWNAAWDATWNAARDAAGTAGAAARDSERQWQTRRLCEYLEIEVSQ